MRFPVARYPGFVAVCSVMLVTLTVGCETEPEPALSVNGTWMGSEQVLDSNSPVRALRWELALVDVPPDSIWGSVRFQGPDQDPGWSLAEPLTGWRDGTSVVLEWGPTGSIRTRYEAEVGLVEDAAHFMTGRLFLGNSQRPYAQLSVEKTP